MSQYTLADFIDRTRQKDRGEGFFEQETDRMLEVNLDGRVWMKMGSMVAYNGSIKFERETILGQGIGNLFKKAISGEGTRLTKAEGVGVMYVADKGKKVSILNLQNESIFVNGNDVLAFEESITSEIKMMKKVTSVLAGGLFNVRLEGSGLIAITTHYDPVSLLVKPGNPITTDPNATVAWSGTLEPKLKKDISLKTFVGRGSGESIQMEFDGDGFVIIQPYEEVSFQAAV